MPKDMPADVKIEAIAGKPVELPSGNFLSNAEMSRAGMDLHLTGPNGHTIVVEGYFAQQVPPDLVTHDGARLTPAMVSAFVPPEHAGQYAASGQIVNDVSPAGKITKVVGDAHIIHADGTKTVAHEGSLVYQGDVVETSKAGAVNIQFADNTTFAISDNARMSVDQFVYHAADHTGSTFFSMLQGVFVYTSGLIGKSDPGAVNIETPVGSIGIRGTVIAAHILPAGQNSQITIVDGAITLTNGTGTQELNDHLQTVSVNGYQSQPASIAMDAHTFNSSYQSMSSVVGNELSHFTGMGTAAPAEHAAPAPTAAPAAENINVPSAPTSAGSSFGSGTGSSFASSSESSAASTASTSSTTTSGTGTTAATTTNTNNTVTVNNDGSHVTTGLNWSTGATENSTSSFNFGISTSDNVQEIKIISANGVGGTLSDLSAHNFIINNNITDSVIAGSDIQNLTFTPAHNTSGTETITYETESQGVFSAVNTVTVNISPVPIVTESTLSLSQGQVQVVSTANLSASESAANPTLTYALTSNGTVHGHFSFAMDPTTTITSFTQAELTAGQVEYVTSTTSSGTDSYNFTVSDGTFTTNSTSPFNINVTPSTVVTSGYDGGNTGDVLISSGGGNTIQISNNGFAAIDGGTGGGNALELLSFTGGASSFTLNFAGLTGYGQALNSATVHNINTVELMGQSNSGNSITLSIEDVFNMTPANNHTLTIEDGAGGFGSGSSNTTSLASVTVVTGLTNIDTFQTQALALGVLTSSAQTSLTYAGTYHGSTVTLIIEGATAATHLSPAPTAVHVAEHG